MNDIDLRNSFDQWAAPLRAATPPPVTAIRHRARRRTVRLAAATGTVLAVAGLIAAATAASVASRSAPHRAPAAHGGSRYLAGRQLPSDATPADVPYFVTASGSASQVLVWNETTGEQTGLVTMPAKRTPGHARYPTMITAIAAAGDDRTFVLALVPSPPVTTAITTPEPTWIYELRLTATGHPQSLRQVPVRGLDTGVTGNVNRAVAAIAISADGTRLAVAVDGNRGDQNRRSSIVVVDLRTGAQRSWTSAGPDALTWLSWSGDARLAFADNGNNAGLRLLDTAAGGTLDQASRQVIAWKTTYHGASSVQWPVISQDGRTAFATMEQGARGLELVQFDARTGRPANLLLGPSAVAANSYCGPLWVSGNGQSLIATCSWGTDEVAISNGTAQHIAIPPGALSAASVANGAGGLLIAW
jgi:hypothetical protein